MIIVYNPSPISNSFGEELKSSTLLECKCALKEVTSENRT